MYFYAIRCRSQRALQIKYSRSLDNTKIQTPFSSRFPLGALHERLDDLSCRLLYSLHFFSGDEVFGIFFGETDNHTNNNPCKAKACKPHDVPDKAKAHEKAKSPNEG